MDPNINHLEAINRRCSMSVDDDSVPPASDVFRNLPGRKTPGVLYLHALCDLDVSVEHQARTELDKFLGNAPMRGVAIHFSGDAFVDVRGLAILLYGVQIGKHRMTVVDPSRSLRRMLEALPLVAPFELIDARDIAARN